jgi:RNA polymerase sigma-70 factor (ECF subfamily)
MASETAVFGRLTAWAAPAREADWDALFAEELPRVYNFFRYRVGSGAVAEDLTSATFVKAWIARHRYRRDLSAFRTWLMVIARNVATDHFRRRRDHAPLEAAEDLPGGASPEEIAERRSDVERLGRLLAALPEREHELVALKYGAGMTTRAIARVAGLSESNVGTILHRAVGTLRAGWEKGAR